MNKINAYLIICLLTLSACGTESHLPDTQVTSNPTLPSNNPTTSEAVRPTVKPSPPEPPITASAEPSISPTTKPSPIEPSPSSSFRPSDTDTETTYNIIDDYSSSDVDQSFMVTNTNYNKSTIVSWVNDQKDTLTSLFLNEESKTFSIPIKPESTIIANSYGENEVHAITKSAFENISVGTGSSPSKNSFLVDEYFSKEIDNYIVYGITIDADKNGFAIVSNEQAPTSENIDANRKTTIGILKITKGEITHGEEITSLIELPRFYKGFDVIKSVSLDKQGNGFVLASPLIGTNAVNHNRINVYGFKNFTLETTQQIDNKNKAKHPEINIKSGTGNIDWKNGQFTKINKFILSDNISLSYSENTSYFLNPEGNGFKVDKSANKVIWKSVKHYLTEEKGSEIQFTNGTQVHSLTVTLAQSPPTLAGLNYTCNSRTSCSGEALNRRLVWTKSLE